MSLSQTGSPVFSGRGGVIHPSAPGGQAIGEVFIEDDFLVFNDEEKEIYFEYPFNQCKPELGGYENSILYFRPAQQGEPVFYLDDLNYLDKLVEIAPTELRHIYQKLQKRKRSGSPLSCCLSFFFGIGVFTTIIISLLS